MKVTTRSTFKNYKGRSIGYDTYYNIITLFFKKVVQRIFKGEVFELPESLGKIYILKKENSINKASIDFKKTNENKKLGINQTVMRTNPYYHTFVWTHTSNDGNTSKANFSFVATYDNNREIPKHFN
jgi:hypothetical protein